MNTTRTPARRGSSARRRARAIRPRGDRRAGVAQASRAAGDDEVPKGCAIDRGDLRDLRQQRLADDEHRGARVVQHVPVVRRRPERVQGNRHGADLDRTKEAVHERRTVGEQQDDPFPGPDVQCRAQRATEPIRACQHLRVGDPLVAAFDRDVVAAPVLDVAIDEPRRRVEDGGDPEVGCRHTHSRVPCGAGGSGWASWLAAATRQSPQETLWVRTSRRRRTRRDTRPRKSGARCRARGHRTRSRSGGRVMTATPTPIEMSSPSFAGDRNRDSSDVRGM